MYTYFIYLSNPPSCRPQSSENGKSNFEEEKNNFGTQTFIMAQLWLTEERSGDDQSLAAWLGNKYSSMFT